MSTTKHATCSPFLDRRAANAGLGSPPGLWATRAPRSQRSSAALTGASGVFASATMIQEIEFAPDSPLEEAVTSEPVSEVGSPAAVGIRRDSEGFMG
jgi:hypothetical protein